MEKNRKQLLKVMFCAFMTVATIYSPSSRIREL